MTTLFEATAFATFDDLDGESNQRIFELSNDQGTDKIWLGNNANSTDIWFQVEQNGSTYTLMAPDAIVEGEAAE